MKKCFQHLNVRGVSNSQPVSSEKRDLLPKMPADKQCPCSEIEPHCSSDFVEEKLYTTLEIEVKLRSSHLDLFEDY